MACVFCSCLTDGSTGDTCRSVPMGHRPSYVPVVLHLRTSLSTSLQVIKVSIAVKLLCRTGCRFGCDEPVTLMR
eukprot:6078209-Prymnesium_polylepis.1